jgi:hypothetical protein
LKQKANTIQLKSFAGDRWHTISLDKKTCDCEQFQISGRCDHLSALGLYRPRPFTPSVRPTFSQALSGLVKSLRIRRVDEAVYWLIYLDTFREKQYRFRTARRLLIGSVEDGHSIPVMEEIAGNFRRTSNTGTDLLHLVTDAMRICKLPNWWHPDSGGPDYIYQSLVGQRQWWYKKWNHKLKSLERETEAAVEAQDKATALGGVMAYAALQKSEQVGATKQAEFINGLAEKKKHDLAIRLCRVHLSQKSALSGDNNFLCMATWMLGGGVSPIAERIEPVTTEECKELLDVARKRWKNPHPIPRWCCDSIHCAGDDPRFAGMLPQMMAVCRAFEHYGRVSPDDIWLPSFQCYEGLVIESENQAGETE